jgi:Neuraminidase (sialidase)
MNRKRRNGTWGSPVKVSGSETTGTGIGADVKTNSAGTVFGVWPDTGSRKIYMVRSTNGGQSYSKPKAIASTFGSYDIGVPAMNSRRVLLYVSAAAYKSLTRNLVYAAWTDLSGAPGCRAASNEPRNNTASACKTRIWFARSTDGGATWSAKKMINNQAGKNDQLNPSLTVDETTGRLAVMYYSTVGGPRTRTNVWYQSSCDQGATWSAPFKVTSQPTDETSVFADESNQYGDYNGLSGYAGTFFPVWTDRRGGDVEQIWTAALVDAGACP